MSSNSTRSGAMTEVGTHRKQVKPIHVEAGWSNTWPFDMDAKLILAKLEPLFRRG